MKIVMLYDSEPRFLWDSHDKVGLGGSENCFIKVAFTLAKLGHEIKVYNRNDLGRATIEPAPNLKWSSYEAWNPNERADVVYSLRFRHPFEQSINSTVRCLFLADTESIGLGEDVEEGRINLVMSVSNWQKEKIQKEEGISDENWVVASNGIDINEFPAEVQKVGRRCLFTATPERGLSNLLDVWPRIHERFNNATLHVYSSFKGWGVSDLDNENMCRDVYARMHGMEGVTNFKHASRAEIRRAQKEAELYLYPSDFYETCCMSVIEAMAAGCVPIVTGRAALLERVKNRVSGFVIPPIGASTERYQDLFFKTVAGAFEFPFMLDEMAATAKSYAYQFDYDYIVSQWTAEWKSRR